MTPSSSRRVHSAEFKTKVLAECQKPGVSVASVALAHGVNANLVRKWQIGRGLKRCGLAATEAPAVLAVNVPATVTTPALQFLPVTVPATSGQAIHVELRRGQAHLSVQWPAPQAEACAAWLRELATSLR